MDKYRDQYNRRLKTILVFTDKCINLWNHNCEKCKYIKSCKVIRKVLQGGIRLWKNNARFKDKVKFIFKRLICGGVGYAPTLWRYKKKYYQVRGDCEPEFLKQLSDLTDKYTIHRNGFNLWLQHKNDNIVTAKEFLDIIFERRKQAKKFYKSLIRNFENLDKMIKDLEEKFEEIRKEAK